MLLTDYAPTAVLLLFLAMLFQSHAWIGIAALFHAGGYGGVGDSVETPSNEPSEISSGDLIRAAVLYGRLRSYHTFVLFQEAVKAAGPGSEAFRQADEYLRSQARPSNYEYGAWSAIATDREEPIGALWALVVMHQIILNPQYPVEPLLRRIEAIHARFSRDPLFKGVPIRDVLLQTVIATLNMLHQDGLTEEDSFREKLAMRLDSQGFFELFEDVIHGESVHGYGHMLDIAEGVMEAAIEEHARLRTQGSVRRVDAVSLMQAALIHDATQPINPKGHERNAARLTPAILSRLSDGLQRITHPAKVADMVLEHGTNRPPHPSSLESEILHDVDTLDALNPLRIQRINEIQYGRPFYRPMLGDSAEKFLRVLPRSLRPAFEALFAAARRLFLAPDPDGEMERRVRAILLESKGDLYTDRTDTLTFHLKHLGIALTPQHYLKTESQRERAAGVGERYLDQLRRIVSEKARSAREEKEMLELIERFLAIWPGAAAEHFSAVTVEPAGREADPVLSVPDQAEAWLRATAGFQWLKEHDLRQAEALRDHTREVAQLLSPQFPWLDRQQAFRTISGRDPPPGRYGRGRHMERALFYALALTAGLPEVFIQTHLSEEFKADPAAVETYREQLLLLQERYNRIPVEARRVFWYGMILHDTGYAASADNDAHEENGAAYAASPDGRLPWDLKGIVGAYIRQHTGLGHVLLAERRFADYEARAIGDLAKALRQAGIADADRTARVLMGLHNVADTAAVRETGEGGVLNMLRPQQLAEVAAYITPQIESGMESDFGWYRLLMHARRSWDDPLPNPEEERALREAVADVAGSPEDPEGRLFLDALAGNVDLHNRVFLIAFALVKADPAYRLMTRFLRDLTRIAEQEGGEAVFSTDISMLLARLGSNGNAAVESELLAHVEQWIAANDGAAFAEKKDGDWSVMGMPVVRRGGVLLIRTEPSIMPQNDVPQSPARPSAAASANGDAEGEGRSALGAVLEPWALRLFQPQRSRSRHFAFSAFLVLVVPLIEVFYHVPLAGFLLHTFVVSPLNHPGAKRDPARTAAYLKQAAGVAAIQMTGVALWFLRDAQPWTAAAGGFLIFLGLMLQGFLFAAKHERRSLGLFVLGPVLSASLWGVFFLTAGAGANLGLPLQPLQALALGLALHLNVHGWYNLGRLPDYAGDRPSGAEPEQYAQEEALRYLARLQGADKVSSYAEFQEFSRAARRSLAEIGMAAGLVERLKEALRGYYHRYYSAMKAAHRELWDAWTAEYKAQPDPKRAVLERLGRTAIRPTEDMEAALALILEIEGEGAMPEADGPLVSHSALAHEWIARILPHIEAIDRRHSEEFAGVLAAGGVPEHYIREVLFRLVLATARDYPQFMEHYLRDLDAMNHEFGHTLHVVDNLLKILLTEHRDGRFGGIPLKAALDAALPAGLLHDMAQADPLTTSLHHLVGADWAAVLIGNNPDLFDADDYSDEVLTAIRHAITAHRTEHPRPGTLGPEDFALAEDPGAEDRIAAYNRIAQYLYDADTIASADLERILNIAASDPREPFFRTGESPRDLVVAVKHAITRRDHEHPFGEGRGARPLAASDRLPGYYDPDVKHTLLLLLKELVLSMNVEELYSDTAVREVQGIYDEKLAFIRRKIGTRSRLAEWLMRQAAKTPFYRYEEPLLPWEARIEAHRFVDAFLEEWSRYTGEIERPVTLIKPSWLIAAGALHALLGGALAIAAGLISGSNAIAVFAALTPLLTAALLIVIAGALNQPGEENADLIILSQASRIYRGVAGRLFDSSAQPDPVEIFAKQGLVRADDLESGAVEVGPLGLVLNRRLLLDGSGESGLEAMRYMILVVAEEYFESTRVARVFRRLFILSVAFYPPAFLVSSAWLVAAAFSTFPGLAYALQNYVAVTGATFVIALMVSVALMQFSLGWRHAYAAYNRLARELSLLPRDIGEEALELERLNTVVNWAVESGYPPDMFLKTLLRRKRRFDNRPVTVEQLRSLTGALKTRPSLLETVPEADADLAEHPIFGNPVNGADTADVNRGLRGRRLYIMEGRSGYGWIALAMKALESLRQGALSRQLQFSYFMWRTFRGYLFQQLDASHETGHLPDRMLLTPYVGTASPSEARSLAWGNPSVKETLPVDTRAVQRYVEFGPDVSPQDREAVEGLLRAVQAFKSIRDENNAPYEIIIPVRAINSGRSLERLVNLLSAEAGIEPEAIKIAAMGAEPKGLAHLMRQTSVQVYAMGFSPVRVYRDADGNLQSENAIGDALLPAQSDELASGTITLNGKTYDVVEILGVRSPSVRRVVSEGKDYSLKTGVSSQEMQAAERIDNAYEERLKRFGRLDALPDGTLLGQLRALRMYLEWTLLLKHMQPLFVDVIERDEENGVLLREYIPELKRPGQVILEQQGLGARLGMWARLMHEYTLIVIFTLFFAKHPYTIPLSDVRYDTASGHLRLLSFTGVLRTQPVAGTVILEGARVALQLAAAAVTGAADAPQAWPPAYDPRSDWPAFQTMMEETRKAAALRKPWEAAIGAAIRDASGRIVGGNNGAAHTVLHAEQRTLINYMTGYLRRQNKPGLEDLVERLKRMHDATFEDAHAWIDAEGRAVAPPELIEVEFIKEFDRLVERIAQAFPGIFEGLALYVSLHPCNKCTNTLVTLQRLGMRELVFGRGAANRTHKGNKKLEEAYGTDEAGRPLYRGPIRPEAVAKNIRGYIFYVTRLKWLQEIEQKRQRAKLAKSNGNDGAIIDFKAFADQLDRLAALERLSGGQYKALAVNMNALTDGPAAASRRSWEAVRAALAKRADSGVPTLLLVDGPETPGLLSRIRRDMPGVLVLSSFGGALGREIATGDVLWDRRVPIDSADALRRRIAALAEGLNIALDHNAGDRFVIAEGQDDAGFRAALADLLSKQEPPLQMYAAEDETFVIAPAGLGSEFARGMFRDYLAENFGLRVRKAEMLRLSRGSDDAAMLRNGGVFAGNPEELLRGAHDVIFLKDGAEAVRQAFSAAGFETAPQSLLNRVLAAFGLSYEGHWEFADAGGGARNVIALTNAGWVEIKPVPPAVTDDELRLQARYSKRLHDRGAPYPVRVFRAKGGEAFITLADGRRFVAHEHIAGTRLQPEDASGALLARLGSMAAEMHAAARDLLPPLSDDEAPLGGLLREWDTHLDRLGSITASGGMLEAFLLDETNRRYLETQIRGHLSAVMGMEEHLGGRRRWLTLVDLTASDIIAEEASPDKPLRITRMRLGWSGRPAEFATVSPDMTMDTLLPLLYAYRERARELGIPMRAQEVERAPEILRGAVLRRFLSLAAEALDGKDALAELGRLLRGLKELEPLLEPGALEVFLSAVPADERYRWVAEWSADRRAGGTAAPGQVSPGPALEDLIGAFRDSAQSL